MNATVALHGECSGMRVPRDQRHEQAAHLIAGVPHRLPAMCRRGPVHLKQSKLGRMLAPSGLCLVCAQRRLPR